MVTTVEDAATRCVTLPPSPVLKASLKRSLPSLTSLPGAACLPEDIPLDSLKKVVPPFENELQTTTAAKSARGKDTKKFHLGRNLHGSCLEITEPDMDDEITGEKDAYMASVLARYRKTLTEKTKYHLGAYLTCKYVFLASSLLNKFVINCYPAHEFPNESVRAC